MTTAVAEPQGVAQSVTPSGIEIYYQSKPKRLYRVRQQHGSPEENFAADAEGKLLATTGWLEVPSVTTVLDVLDKPALPWWGMGVGIEGVQFLVETGAVRFKPTTWGGVLIGKEDNVLSKDDIIELLTVNKKTTNHVRDEAGKRGQDVHDALEAWAKTGVPPRAHEFPVEQQGYVNGLNAFLHDLGQDVKPLDHEVMVGSLEYQYAGRYDLRLQLNEPRRVRVKITDSRKEQYMKFATVPAGVGIIDLKTSKGIYPTHILQLEGYELASVECGFEPTDWRAVLHVTPDGYYQLRRSRATRGNWIDVRNLYDTYKQAEEALKL